MSAIYGVINWEMPVNESELSSMGRRLQHRATEPARLWNQATAVLGHLGLPTTRSSRFGGELHRNEEHRITVAADTRLDHRTALAERLDTSAECSDAALIALAYLKWGDEFIEYLRGDFAIAIWDERHTRLLMARDVFGVRPLYYRTDSTGVRFASEPKALLHAESGINHQRVAEFLQSLPPTGTHTFWRDIECLTSGTIATFSPAATKVRRFDALLFSSAHENESSSRHFREIFLHSVRNRLDRVGTLACMLSGGLDSSAITAAAAAVEPPALTISNVFPEYCTECDESGYIQSLLAGGKCQPQFVTISGAGNYDHLVTLMHQQAEPFSGFGLFSCGSLYKAAQERGISIMLDGHGGDEVATGTDWWIGSLVRERRWLPLLAALRERSRVFQEPYMASYLKAMLRVHVAHRWPVTGIFRLLQRTRAVSGRRTYKSSTPAIFREEFLQLAPHDESATTGKRHATAASDAEAHRKMLRTSIQFRYLEELDRASAAHRVEARYPFLDRDVVAYCLSAKPEEKFHRGWPRAIVRNSLDDLLPAAIRTRLSKTSFLNPLVNSLRGIGHDLWDSLSAQDHAEPLVHRNGLFSAVRALHERPKPEPGLVLSLWTALVTFVWLHERQRLCAG